MMENNKIYVVVGTNKNDTILSVLAITSSYDEALKVKQSEKGFDEINIMEEDKKK